jgi:molybdopterin-guanine dinucleotide biosynthesis protein A
VLAGGKSTRFGSNKSIAMIDGLPMARIVANNLYDATKVLPQLIGADDVVARQFVWTKRR